MDRPPIDGFNKNTHEPWVRLRRLAYEPHGSGAFLFVTLVLIFK